LMESCIARLQMLLAEQPHDASKKVGRFDWQYNEWRGFKPGVKPTRVRMTHRQS
jgi:hypothetical protein